MVNVVKGLLVKCSDSAIKQYILHLDQKESLGRRFILQDLDELHVFVALDVAKQLQQKIDELMEKNSYSEFDQQNKGK
ncbi:general transcription factor IIH subunit 5-like [Halichondria panicea]|uniref:general transcription factor IIH subunit 5-like n=1 Tax=Halichondria panicea TaxID=6063 RepID=UPI00312B5569